MRDAYPWTILPRMTHASWKDAVSAMRRRVSSCDDKQRMLADVAGIKLPQRLPRIIAAARLRNALAEPLGLTLRQSSDSQRLRLEELAEDASRRMPTADSAAEAEAWILYFYLRRRMKALGEIKLNKGDIVRRKTSGGEVDEVVSISDDGVVYFTGGGSRAWPDVLEIVARYGDNSEEGLKFRKIANNRASNRATQFDWSGVKAKSLQKYIASDSITEIDIEELRSVIERASDEQPIQEFFQNQPHILASLMRGPQRYCIPKVSLGGKYVADFFLADVDSTGIRWVLVELETPGSPVTLLSEDNFDKYARKGISQIEEWREWIQDNLATARRFQEDNGLGLVDIRPQADGLVLVGRRAELRKNASWLRNRLLEGSGIQVRTYDGLLEQLEGIRTFEGPWAANPNVLRR